MLENVNLVAILVSALLSVAVGSIWYSPFIFGSIWMKSVGIDTENGLSPKLEVFIATARGIIAQIIFFFVLAQLIAISIEKAIPLSTLGSLLVALMVAGMLGTIIWEKRSIPLFLIHAGYMVIALFGGMGIIAYWPW